MILSVIIPVLNEAAQITQTLDTVQDLRAAGHEVILADGGSSDQTVQLARGLADQVIDTPSGRATQMNAGAAAALGGILLFLHADTRLPRGAAARIIEAIESGRGWGRFDVQLSGRHRMLRVVERMISWRSRLTGVATGDQAIFVRRDWFEAAGGYAAIPLMEDVRLSKELLRRGRPACLPQRVVTSSRRWEEHGIWGTILLMWRLRLRYYLGADPRDLASAYRVPSARQGR